MQNLYDYWEHRSRRWCKRHQWVGLGTVLTPRNSWAFPVILVKFFSFFSQIFLIFSKNILTSAWLASHWRNSKTEFRFCLLADSAGHLSGRFQLGQNLERQQRKSEQLPNTESQIDGISAKHPVRVGEPLPSWNNGLLIRSLILFFFFFFSIWRS